MWHEACAVYVYINKDCALNSPIPLVVAVVAKRNDRKLNEQFPPHKK